ncbi:MAG: hypothetical protein IPK16_33410 [Anaerolineales bacterium]|nr:hypothetical protein [Anaerolineales bacterium]
MPALLYAGQALQERATSKSCTQEIRRFASRHNEPVTVLLPRVRRYQESPMTLKSQIHSVINQLGFEVHRIKPPDHELEAMYAAGGCVPHSVGYAEARNRLIIDVIQDPERLKIFRQKDTLPQGYGVSFDERCVEYPWMFSHLRQGPACVLDAGSITNFKFVTDHPAFKDIRCSSCPGRSHPVIGSGASGTGTTTTPNSDPTEFFDTVICISTLEHVGFDNSFYGADETSKDRYPDDFTTVMAERRELSPVAHCCSRCPMANT